MSFGEALRAYTNLGSAGGNANPPEVAQIDLVSTPVEESELGVQLITPSSYNAVQVVADTYSAGELVIVSLVKMTNADSRRVLDFCSGLVYGTKGQLRKLGSHLFLLQPPQVELAPEDIELVAKFVQEKSSNAS